MSRTRRRLPTRARALLKDLNKLPDELRGHVTAAAMGVKVERVVSMEELRAEGRRATRRRAA